MKISNQMSGASAPSGDNALEIKSGDTLQAVVKEKLPNQEAVIQTRGRELRVQFEGAVPQEGESVAVTVKQMDGARIRVKAADLSKPANAPSVSAESGARLSGSYTSDEQQVVKLLADKGITVTKEREAVLRSFMRTSSGELPQKLATVQAILQKGLPLTSEHLSAVHEALNGPPLSSLVNKVAGAAAPRSQAADVQSGSGLSPHETSDEIQILKLLADKKISLTKEQEAAIRTFARTSSGELSQKLATIEAVLQKGLPVTAEQLASVHKTVNGVSAGRSKGAEQSASTIGNSVISTNPTQSNVSGGHNLNLQELAKAILQQWGANTAAQTAAGLTDVIQTDPASASNAVQQQGTDKEEEAIAALRKLMDDKTGLSEILYRMKKLQSELDGPEAERWENTMHNLRKLQLTGAAEEGQELLHQFLQEASQKDKPAASASPQDVSGSVPAHRDDNYFAAGAAGQAELVAKSLLVTEVTRRLSQAAHDFKTMKQDITRNLNHIVEIVKSTPRNIYPQVQAALEASIDKLDKSILKSDLTMLTDMGMEKQLLLASSRLADARKLLMQGQNARAQAILEEVSSKLEQMNWRPADVKVRHLLFRQQTAGADLPLSSKLAAEWNAATASSGGEHTARSVMDTIRAMGFNHESDAARQLVSSGSMDGYTGKGGDQEHQHNVKALLLKLAQEDTGVQGKAAEQALNSITGQQLLSKQDGASSMQSLMLSLPLMLSGQSENVKVIVNSRQNGEKMDWENCSLYFALQTKKLGDLGILATVTDRRLSLTLKNDSPRFQEKMESLASVCRDKLEEIGFQVGPIRFAPLTVEEQQPQAVPSQNQRQPVVPTSPAKGFDFKI